MKQMKNSSLTPSGGRKLYQSPQMKFREVMAEDEFCTSIDAGGNAGDVDYGDGGDATKGDGNTGAQKHTFNVWED